MGLSIAEDNRGFVRLLAEMAGKAEGPVLQQTLHEIGYFLTTGFTWNNFSKTLLERTASIDPQIPMGSSVQSWAIGKSYLVGVTVAVPGGSKGVDRVVVFPPGQEDPAAQRTFATYQATRSSAGAEVLPTYVPAAFSVTFGAGEDSMAPFHYVAPCALPPETKLAYKGAGPKDGLFGCCCQQQFKDTTATLGEVANFDNFAGSLPLGDVMACTSSFLGDIALLPGSGVEDPFQKVASTLNGDLSSWAGSASHARGLSQAFSVVDDQIYRSKRVTQKSFDGLVSNAVLCTIDGGFTDETGIANAVAAGATELVVIQNMTEDEEPSRIFELFGNTDRSHCECKPRFIAGRDAAMDSAGLPGSASEKSGVMKFPIFAESEEAAREQWESISASGSLSIPDGSDSQLIGMVVGTMTATTANQKYFGISSNDTQIRMHIVLVNTKLNSGSIVDFHDYSTLAQEIVSTLQSDANRTLVEKTVLPFFLDLAPSCPSVGKDNSRPAAVLGGA